MYIYSISDIYRTNMFHLTSTGCALVLQKDLEYWGIDELMMEPCCALKYYPEIETCVNEKQVRILTGETRLLWNSFRICQEFHCRLLFRQKSIETLKNIK